MNYFLIQRRYTHEWDRWFLRVDVQLNRQKFARYNRILSSMKSAKKQRKHRKNLRNGQKLIILPGAKKFLVICRQVLKPSFFSMQIDCIFIFYIFLYVLHSILFCTTLNKSCYHSWILCIIIINPYELWYSFSTVVICDNIKISFHSIQDHISSTSSIKFIYSFLSRCTRI